MFAGASNVLVKGGCFNDVKGKYTIHSERKVTTNVNSYNLIGNTIENANNNNQSIHGNARSAHTHGQTYAHTSNTQPGPSAINVMQNVNNHPQHGNSLFYSNELQRSAIAQARHAHTSGPVGFATHTPQWTNQSSVSTMVNQVPGQFVNMQHGDCKPMSPEMKAQFQAFMAHSMQELHSELAGNSNQLEVVAGGEHDEQIGYEEVDIEDVAVERIQSPLTSSMGGMSLNESTQASTSRASDSNATHSGPSASVQDQPQNQPGIMNFRETFLESMQKTGLVAMDPSLFQAMPRASNIPPQSNSTVTHEFIHGDHVIVDNSAHVVNLGHSGVVANNRVIDSYRAAEPSKDDQIREGDNDKQERPSRRKQGFQKFFKRDHTSP